jgi:glycosyltransferase involved in cell wall biosynthesis
MARVRFVTNFAAHYRIQGFELLAARHRIKYLFFSKGTESYWNNHIRPVTGAIESEIVTDITLPGGLNVNPKLYWKLGLDDYDIVVSGINGRINFPVAYIIAKVRRKPFILWTGLWAHPQSRVHRATRWLVRRIYRGADAIVVYGDHIREALVQDGIDDRKIFTAWQVVDNLALSRIAPPEELKKIRDELSLPPFPVVLCVARLTSGKGLEYLVDAVTRVGQSRELVLLLIGDGELAEPLLAIARRRGIGDRIRIVSYVRNDLLYLYYALCDVFVLPSITTPMFKEPWGLVVNEAMNQGRPVIATTAVGAAMGGLIDDGVNGIVVPERNSEAIASALERVLGDRAYAARLGDRARSTIASWTREQWASGFLQAIEYVSEERPAATG